jgi:hypothetical protein
MARTAVVAGTATAVSNRVSRRQADRWSQQGDTPPPGYGYAQDPAQQQAYAAPAEDEKDRQIAQLKELADLKAQGVLTEEEFAAQKAQILG